MENARSFTDRLANLLARERTALGEFLVALAEFDRKRHWLSLGYGSLFDFLHRELGLSKGAAFYRKAAVDLIHRFPEIVEPIRDGRLCLMSVAEVARVLTPENRSDVLPRFFRLSKREAQALAATLAPRESPPLREVVTTVRAAVAAPALSLARPASALSLELPSPAPSLAASPTLDLETSSPAPQSAAVQPVEPARSSVAPVPAPPQAEGASDAGRSVATAPAPACTTTSQPLTSDLSRLHVTVSRRFLAKLEKARAALSHSHPGASADEILEAGLDLLIERHEKRRGIVARPRNDAPASKPEHVPAHVKRAVWKRDGGRCQWKVDGGGICGSVHRLQLDHVVPRARGGASTVANLRILCAVHNDRAARQAYGDAWMNRYTAARAPSDAAPTPPA
jgi:hypothetical protein